MNTYKIKGQVVYQQLGTGFWGIIDENKKKLRPVTMPDVLKQEGLKVELLVEKAQEEVSIFMWGKAINIIEVISSS